MSVEQQSISSSSLSGRSSGKGTAAPQTQDVSGSAAGEVARVPTKGHTDRRPGDTKQCVVCGVVKPIESFYRYHRNKDGRLGSCIKCFSARQKWYAAVRERRRDTRWLAMRNYA